jgi:hypothetical protein
MRAHNGTREDRLAAVVEHALDLIWAAIADECPEATSGDVGIDRDLALEDAARAAVESWVALNVPKTGEEG